MATSSDAIAQELLRWTKDNKPEDRGWKGFFFSPGFIMFAVCLILIIVVLVIWWRWGKSSGKAPDVETGNTIKKSEPAPRSKSIKYVDREGRVVSPEKVKH